MNNKQRADLLDDNRYVNINVPHATKANHFDLIRPANLPRKMVTVFCNTARPALAGSKSDWRIYDISADIVSSYMVWCKQSCRAESIAPYSLAGLSTVEKINHISGASSLGINSRLLKLPESYFQLPGKEFISLWIEAHSQDLTHISDTIMRQFPAYIHQRTTLKELLEIYQAATGFLPAQEPLVKAITYKMNDTHLQTSDAVDFYKHVHEQGHYLGCRPSLGGVQDHTAYRLGC